MDTAVTPGTLDGSHRGAPDLQETRTARIIRTGQFYAAVAHSGGTGPLSFARVVSLLIPTLVVALASSVVVYYTPRDLPATTVWDHVCALNISLSLCPLYCFRATPRGQQYPAARRQPTPGPTLRGRASPERRLRYPLIPLFRFRAPVQCSRARQTVFSLLAVHTPYARLSALRPAGWCIEPTAGPRPPPPPRPDRTHLGRRESTPHVVAPCHGHGLQRLPTEDPTRDIGARAHVGPYFRTATDACTDAWPGPV